MNKPCPQCGEIHQDATAGAFARPGQTPAASRAETQKAEGQQAYYAAREFAATFPRHGGVAWVMVDVEGKSGAWLAGFKQSFKIIFAQDPDTGRQIALVSNRPRG